MTTVTVTLKNTKQVSAQIKLNLSDNVSSLKEHASKIENDNGVENFKYVFKGNVLKDDTPLSSYGIKDGDVIIFVIKKSQTSAQTSAPTQTQATPTATPTQAPTVIQMPAEPSAFESQQPMLSHDDLLGGAPDGAMDVSEMIITGVMKQLMKNPSLLVKLFTQNKEVIINSLQNPTLLMKLFSQDPVLLLKLLTRDPSFFLEIISQDPNYQNLRSQAPDPTMFDQMFMSSIMSVGDEQMQDYQYESMPTTVPVTTSSVPAPTSTPTSVPTVTPTPSVQSIPSTQTIPQVSSEEKAFIDQVRAMLPTISEKDVRDAYASCGKNADEAFNLLFTMSSLR